MTESMERWLGRMEEKIDNVRASQIRIEGQLENHSKRIASLEKQDSRFLGGIALAVFVIGVLVAVL
jgi:hypothetical protein